MVDITRRHVLATTGAAAGAGTAVWGARNLRSTGANGENGQQTDSASSDDRDGEAAEHGAETDGRAEESDDGASEDGDSGGDGDGNGDGVEDEQADDQDAGADEDADEDDPETDTDEDEPDADDGPADEGSVEYLDCETVRVTGSFDDVFLRLFWWDEEGLIGTIDEPVGSVDGERTISATEEFGPFAHGPVLTEVELFEPGTPRVPGGGDVAVSNPDAESCADSVREAYDGPGEPEPSGLE